MDLTICCLFPLPYPVQVDEASRVVDASKKAVEDAMALGLPANKLVKLTKVLEAAREKRAGLQQTLEQVVYERSVSYNQLNCMTTLLHEFDTDPDARSYAHMERAVRTDFVLRTFGNKYRDQVRFPAHCLWNHSAPSCLSPSPFPLTHPPPFFLCLFSSFHPL